MWRGRNSTRKMMRTICVIAVRSPFFRRNCSWPNCKTRTRNVATNFTTRNRAWLVANVTKVISRWRFWLLLCVRCFRRTTKQRPAALWMFSARITKRLQSVCKFSRATLLSMPCSTWSFAFGTAVWLGVGEIYVPGGVTKQRCGVWSFLSSHFCTWIMRSWPWFLTESWNFSHATRLLNILRKQLFCRSFSHPFMHFRLP